MQKKESRRALQRRANGEALLCQEVLKTLAAILIDHEGPITVRRENLMLASELRVDCRADAQGNQVLSLQDQSGKDIFSAAESVHADTDCGENHAPDDAGQGEAVHGV